MIKLWWNIKGLNIFATGAMLNEDADPAFEGFAHKVVQDGLGTWWYTWEATPQPGGYVVGIKRHGAYMGQVKTSTLNLGTAVAHALERIG